VAVACCNHPAMSVEVAALVEFAAETAYMACAGARTVAIRLRADAYHTDTMAPFVVPQCMVAVVDSAECARAGNVAIAYATRMAATVAKQNWEAECTKRMALLLAVQMTVFERLSAPAVLVDHAMVGATAVEQHHSRSTMESMMLWDQP
jgi:hypothetical protein